MLLGHYRVGTLVGAFDIKDLHSEMKKYTGRVAVRGRRDWTRHFWVSAGLAVLSNEIVSDGAGLLKEEIDSAKRGSGFSFADLLADRAGTLFAIASTRDMQAARGMQERLASGGRIADVFPPAADLPEGITAADLDKDYGGIGGPRYRQIVREIERRLATCGALIGQ